MPLLKRIATPVALLLCATSVFAVSSARAASVSHTAQFPLGPYLNGGSHTFPPATVPKFDLAGQCLTSVCVKLDGGNLADIGFENFQPNSAIVTVNAIATITLQRPDLSTLVIVQPTVTTVDTMPAFDGNADYGGTSGKWYFGLVGTDTDSLCLSGASDLTLFSGAGNISLPGFATDNSFQSGAGSWSIGPRPYATITVTYDYRDCSVPAAPSTWSGIKRLLP